MNWRQAVTDIGVAARSGRRVDLLAEDHAKESAGNENKDRKKKWATRTTGHLLVSFGSGVDKARPPHLSEV